MALVLKDRVVESSTSTGTGSFTLSGAETGYQGFSVVGNGSTVFYTIQGKNSDGTLTGEWEVGYGTYNAGSLSRDTVYESSNSNSLVSFAIGLKDVWIDLPAEKAVYLDATNVTNTLGAAQFDTTYATTLGVGQIGWDGNNTLGIGMAGGNVVQKIGEDQYFYCKASSAITKGQVVMFTGAIGASGVPTGAPASGVTDGSYIMGVAAEAIAHNGFGLVQSFGTLRNVNTSGYADGDILWYNPAVAGGMTSTKPSAPNVKVQIAAVINGGSSGGGTILIRINPGSVLGGTDSNVQITAPTTGQSLIYDSGTGVWVNGNNEVINGGTINNTPIGATTPSTGKFTSVTTPSVTATTDSLTLSAISTGVVNIATANGTGIKLSDPGATVANFLNMRGRQAGSNPGIFSNGSDASVGLNLNTKGGGAFNFYSNVAADFTGGTQQFAVTNTNSAVNYVQVTGAATTGAPVISSQGSDSAVDLTLNTKSTGIMRLQTGGLNVMRLRPAASAVNYFDIGQAATTKTPYILANGSDTNVSFAIQTQGTGAIDLAAGSSGVNISNGGTVTAITRTASGSAYTSIPSVAISAPTTAGGVQATATATMFAQSASVASGGTGYTVGDTLTLVGGTFSAAATLTVSTVSAGVITAVTVATGGTAYSVLPTNPISVTGGTGTGATFNVTDWRVNTTFTITNAGSGYIEQPTVSFSGGGGSGAAAYATVGSGTQVKTLGSTLSFYTPSGEAFRVADSNGSSTGYWQAFGATGTPDLRSSGAGSISSVGANSLTFRTNTTTSQFVISHTANAVNYVQITGNATTGYPTISIQGSDASPGLYIQAKGSGSIRFSTNGANSNEQFRVTHVASAVNYLQATGAIATAAPVLSAQGTDTNIDLALTPKGTGLIRFGTYTAGALLATGYINIKAADGTTYKVLVST